MPFQGLAGEYDLRDCRQGAVPYGHFGDCVGHGSELLTVSKKSASSSGKVQEIDAVEGQLRSYWSSWFRNSAKEPLLFSRWQTEAQEGGTKEAMKTAGYVTWESLVERIKRDPDALKYVLLDQMPADQRAELMRIAAEARSKMTRT